MKYEFVAKILLEFFCIPTDKPNFHSNHCAMSLACFKCFSFLIFILEYGREILNNKGYRWESQLDFLPFAQA